MTDPFFSTPLEAATWWVGHGVDVVPVLPQLLDNGGKKAPRPYAEWKWDDPSTPCPPGRVRTPEAVAQFWETHPTAQVAIVLGGYLGAIDIDRAKMGDIVPPDHPTPLPLGEGLRERTKSDGQHLFFRFRAPLPPNKPTRVIAAGGYVDVLCGGLLFTSPSSFENHPGRYEIESWGDIPEYTTVADALRASAPWLVPYWEKRGASAPSDARRRATVAAPAVLPALKTRLEHALAAIEADPTVAPLFHDGHRKPNGEVDRSQTEYRLVGFLKRRGVGEDVAWEIVQACPHTKSPRDRRGYAYFLPEVWERLDGAEPLGEHGPAPADHEFARTEFGNADRLLAAREGKLHFDVARQKWLVWDGRRWALDEAGVARRWTEEVLSDIILESKEADSKEDRAALSSWWSRSSTASRIGSCLDVASHRSGIPVLPDELDPDRFLLVTNNGTLDLRTGELQPHRPDDMATRLAPVAYSPSAKCPLFERFVSEAMSGDQERVDFLQRAIGYSLTGSVREQVFFLLFGGGNNGKSTFLNALRTVFGDYGWHADSSTFLRQDTQRVRQDLAVLRGIRLCTTSEIKDGQHLDEDLVKTITGGDPIQCRYLRSTAELLFHPQLKLWMAVNHKPKITGQDDGIWRRVVLIPWDIKISQKDVDRDFGAQLLEEREGILAWAVRGHMAYQALGLSPPESILEAGRDYRSESDLIGDFLEEAFDPTTKGKADGNAAVTAAEAYLAYRGWAMANGETPRSQKWLGLKLKERGFAQTRNKTTRYWSVSLSSTGHELARQGTRPMREESFRRGYG